MPDASVNQMMSSSVTEYFASLLVMIVSEWFSTVQVESTKLENGPQAPEPVPPQISLSWTVLATGTIQPHELSFFGSIAGFCSATSSAYAVEVETSKDLEGII